MSATRIIPGVLLSWFLGMAVYGQTPLLAPSGSPYMPVPPPVTTLPTLSGTPAPVAAMPPSLSTNTPSAAIVDGVKITSPAANSWLASSPCYCCSPVGGHGPIGAEIFVYTGPTIPVGGGTFSPGLTAGWMVEWGGRTLLFNTAGDRAWAASIGISYQYNNGNPNAVTFPYPVEPGPNGGPPLTTDVRPKNLSRWAFTFAGGRDWFLFGSAEDGAGWTLRFGGDVGGRWGSSHIGLTQAQNPDPQSNYIRRQDVFRALVLGTHVHAEVPVGGWVWFGGFRAEYGFNWWTDLIPNADNRLNDVNLLLTTGFRY